MFPDFDKTTEEMLGAIAAKLESLPPETVRLICSPVLGIATKQAYAPTVYHIEEFVKGLDALKPSHTTYQKFQFEEGIGVEKPWEPTSYVERMRARKLRLDRGKERLKLAKEKYGPKVWMDPDGWLHTGQSII